MTTTYGDLPEDLFNTLQDALGDIEVVKDDIESTLKNELPPQGTYTTRPEDYPVNVSVHKFEEKVDKGRNPGRTLIRFSGFAFGTFQGKEERLKYEFQVSPNKQKKREYAPNDEGKQEWTGNYLDGEDGRVDQDDMPTRLYAQANALYKTANGEYPKKVTDLVGFLTTTPFRLRTFNTPDGKVIVTQLPGRRG